MMQSSSAQDVLTRVADAILPALNLLERMVNTDSPSHHPAGAGQVQTMLQEELSKLGFATKVHPASEVGHSVLEANLDGNGHSRVILLGHADTVFPVGTAMARPYMSSGTRAYGPGVSDMKGGLALMWAALAGLAEACPTENLPDLRVILTADEEIGTPHSKGMIRTLSEGSNAVLNLEPGRPDGSVVISRRGSAHLSVRVAGKESHSGANFAAGRSAIASLARIIVALDGLNETNANWSVNIGTVNGGTATNVVAGKAEATLHLAYGDEEAGKELLNRSRTLIEDNRLEGTEAKLIGDLSFLPMPDTETNRALYHLHAASHKQLGSTLGYEHALGAADAGLTASLGIPTLCGLGPIGGNWHNDQEYLELESFGIRAQALALTIMALARA